MLCPLDSLLLHVDFGLIGQQVVLQLNHLCLQFFDLLLLVLHVLLIVLNDFVDFVIERGLLLGVQAFAQ